MVDSFLRFASNFFDMSSLAYILQPRHLPLVYVPLILGKEASDGANKDLGSRWAGTEKPHTNGPAPSYLLVGRYFHISHHGEIGTVSDRKSVV